MTFLRKELLEVLVDGSERLVATASSDSQFVTIKQTWSEQPLFSVVIDKRSIVAIANWLETAGLVSP